MNQDGTASTTENVVPAARLPLAYVSEDGAVNIRFEGGGHVTFAGGKPAGSIQTVDVPDVNKSRH